MPTISTIIIAKNEEEYIKGCIESVLWTDEIIILDSGSTDSTQEICKEYAPKVKLHVTPDWPGYGIQKNRALKLATSEWILSIDADEKVTPELKNEIVQAINSNGDYVAYKIPVQNYFINRPIRHCFGDDFYTGLAKREFCKFSDGIIHENMVVNGPIGKLQKKLDHFTIDKLEESIGKMNSYSSLSALTMFQDSKKINAFQVLAHACWIFIKIYFLRLGFLDGWPGFVVAFSNFEGTFYKYAKLLEKNRARTKANN